MTVWLAARFVHDLDPLILEIGSLRIWWYGLAYALGFLGAYGWLMRARRRLGWRAEEVLDLAIAFTAGVLAFGRGFDVVVYEWAYYREHLGEVVRLWGGGMASHGVLLGALAATWAFALWRRRSFLGIADELAVPAAFFLALGRIANFINGRIYGTETDLWWAVKFPGAEGLRHPVTLYESAKNFVVAAILVVVARMRPRARGLLFAHFVFWYGFLRLFTDVFRVYRSEVLGIGKGQYFNLFMAAAGLALIVWISRRRPAGTEGEERGRPPAVGPSPAGAPAPALLVVRVVLFAALLLLSLTIPGAWTQRAELWSD